MSKVQTFGLVTPVGGQINSVHVEMGTTVGEVFVRFTTTAPHPQEVVAHIFDPPSSAPDPGSDPGPSVEQCGEIPDPVHLDLTQTSTGNWTGTLSGQAKCDANGTVVNRLVIWSRKMNVSGETECKREQIVDFFGQCIEH